MVPDSRRPLRKGIIGALVGIVLSGGLLLFLFLMNQRISSVKDLTDNFSPPVLGSIRRDRTEHKDPGSFLISDSTPMEALDSYAKLRMNLLYSLAGKEKHTVVITSAIAGEGKSTIAANLAISCAMGGKRVLLVDSDMRRACQRDIFKYSEDSPGLSEALIGECSWREALIPTGRENLSVLPAGKLPPNPAELLSIGQMSSLLEAMQEDFDLVLLDMPPINIVSDAVLLSNMIDGYLMIVRHGFSEFKKVNEALRQMKFADAKIIGFVYNGKNNDKKYYKRNSINDCVCNRGN